MPTCNHAWQTQNMKDSDQISNCTSTNASMANKEEMWFQMWFHLWLRKSNTGCKSAPAIQARFTRGRASHSQPDFLAPRKNFIALARWRFRNFDRVLASATPNLMLGSSFWSLKRKGVRFNLALSFQHSKGKEPKTIHKTSLSKG